MSKQAKITLTADTRNFKLQMEEAKKMLSSLGNVKINPKFGVTPQQAAQGPAGLISSPTPPSSTKATGAGGGGGGGASGGGSSSFQGLKNALAPIVAAVGLGALFHKAVQMADENLKIRSLTQGGATVAAGSKYGFSPSQRRGNALGFAQAAGGIGGRGLNRLTDMGEQIERAYGVSSEQSASFVGASRKAGMGNDGKFLSNAIGAAVASGLEGSKIGEYLRSMQGAIEEMSHGVNVDGASLNGFAAALGQMPFFKNDPARMFEAVRSLNNTFQSGDRFQQGMSTRAILQSAPGSSASSTEFRRSMGLFGTLDQATMKSLARAGVDTRAMGVSGPEIIKNMFEDVMKSTAGMNENDRLYAFQQRTGLSAGASASMYGTLANGGSLDMKKFKEATMSPEERLNETYKNVDGSVKDLGTKIEELIEAIAGDLVPKLAELIKLISKWLGDNGIITGVADAGSKAATGLTAGAGIWGAKKLMNMGKGFGKFAGRGVEAGAEGAGILARGVPLLGNAINAGFAAYDGYNMASDYFGKGKTPSFADVSKLSLETAGIIPGLGVLGAGAGAIGLGQALTTSNTPASGIPSGGGGGTPMSIRSDQQDDGATAENTEATRELTAAIRGINIIGGGNRGSLPSYANPMQRRSIATGKGVK
jgi:hypothetical protein